MSLFKVELISINPKALYIQPSKLDVNHLKGVSLLPSVESVKVTKDGHSVFLIMDGEVMDWE